MKYDYHVIVIGAGSAGLTVASGCSSLGAKVALLEQGKMGGDCLNTGCVPSKAFLKTAHLAHNITRAGDFALDAAVSRIDITKIMDRVRSVVEAVAPNDSKERYEGMGVDVILKRAVLKGPHTVDADGKAITGKYIVIATGSQPLVPPIKGLKDVPYLTNENIFNITKMPEHLIVLGGGPVGLELGQGFRHLGVKVSVVDMLGGIFTKDDPEVGPIMESVLKENGINFHLNSKIIEIKGNEDNITVVIEKDGRNQEINGDQLLVSLGRVPVSKGLGLEDAGVKLNSKGYIVTDDTLRTNISSIFACGDVVGPYQFTHMAGYQGGVVVRNIILPIKTKVDYSAVPWTTYTMPEVAHVGYTEPRAQETGIYRSKVVVDLEKMDRAKADGERTGVLKLVLGEKGRIIGATMVAEKAGEMIPAATMAIKKKLKASAYAGLIFSYPTEAEIYKFASYDVLKDALKPWVKSIIKRLFLN
ncbi:dihydrolipoyl dehydrogenase family protein [Elusimicrobiota bacterium]